MVETVQHVADGLPIGAVGGWLSVPYEVIGGYTELLNEKEALTFTPRYADAGDDPIRMFEDRPNERRLLVPRAYGLHRFDGAMRLRDRRTLGEEMHPVPRLPDPNHPSVLDPAAQARFMSELEAAAREHHHFLAEAPTGSGKCLHVDELVLMFDGSTKRTGDLQIGDRLMGPDSRPRTILSINDGEGALFKVTPVKGRSWRCNGDHILSLRSSSTSKKSVIKHVTVNEWLSWSKSKKHLFKQWRTGVEYNSQPVPYPYLLGAWLGDGWSYGPKIWLGESKKEVAVELKASVGALKERACIGCIQYSFSIRSPFGEVLRPMIRNKHIPHAYMTACREDRLKLLAGLLDTDGDYSKGVANITQKRRPLAEQIATLARSLGLAAYTSVKVVKGVPYYRVSVSGDLSCIPCLTDRMQFSKRRQVKDVTNTGFRIEPDGYGSWRGIVIDGDRQYLLDDFTVTHNTVCALRTAAVIGRKTIVMVHLERLMDQWCDSAHNILGVPENRIGTVQGDKCDWRGKDFVIAMMPSLAMRPYEPDFYRAFGTAIYDEVHRVGAPLLSLTAHLFPALYRWGFSATLGRKDGGERIYYWHIGPVRVVSDAAALPMTVYVKKFTTVRKLWGKNHGSRMQCLSRDPERNAALTSIIVRFYRQGRHALIIGESIRHLQHLMARAVRAGVPATAMGQFTSERVTLEDYVTDKGERKTRVRKTVIRPEELEEVKAESQIIFATYGMMIEGIDIPRLDAGMDVTPRSDATQLIGRIRRPVPGKKRPVWVTFLDTRCSISRRYYEKRCRDYIATGVDIVDGKL